VFVCFTNEFRIILCEKADSTLRSSQAVPHPSTNRALRRLTSEVRRDPVHSTRYGRQRILFSNSISSTLCNMPIPPAPARESRCATVKHTEVCVWHVLNTLQSRGESGWCSDVTSTHGAWEHAGVRFLLSGARRMPSALKCFSAQTSHLCGNVALV
jgi:hypothetical protein